MIVPIYEVLSTEVKTVFIEKYSKEQIVLEDNSKVIQVVVENIKSISREDVHTIAHDVAEDLMNSKFKDAFGIPL